MHWEERGRGSGRGVRGREGESHNMHSAALGERDELLQHNYLSCVCFLQCIHIVIVYFSFVSESYH